MHVTLIEPVFINNISNGVFIPSAISSINDSQRLSVPQSNNWIHILPKNVTASADKTQQTERKTYSSGTKIKASTKLTATPVRNILDTSNDDNKWLSYQQNSQDFYRKATSVHQNHDAIKLPKRRKNYGTLSPVDGATYKNGHKHFPRPKALGKHGIKYHYINGETRQSTQRARQSGVNPHQNYLRHSQMNRPESDIVLKDDPSNFNSFPVHQNINKYAPPTVNNIYSNGEWKPQTGTITPMEYQPRINAQSNQHLSVPFGEGDKHLDEISHTQSFVDNQAGDHGQENIRWLIRNYNTLEYPNQVHIQDSQKYYPQFNSNQQTTKNYVSEPNFYAESRHPPMEEMVAPQNYKTNSLNITSQQQSQHVPIGNQIINSIVEKVHQPHENALNIDYEQYAKSLTYDKNTRIDDGGLHASWGSPPAKSEVQQVHQKELPEGSGNSSSGATTYHEDIQGLPQNGDNLFEKRTSESRLNNVSEPLASTSDTQNGPYPQSHDQEESVPTKKLDKFNPNTKFANSQQNNQIEGDFQENKQISANQNSDTIEIPSRQSASTIPRYLTAGKQGSVRFINPTGPGKPALRVITLGNGGSYELPEGIKLQPGHEIPGTMGLKVPAGFRAHIIFGSKVADSIKNAHKL